MIDTATEKRGRGKPSNQPEIERWLLNLLSAGSRQTNEIYQAGKLRGYSERTLDRVKANLKLKSVQKNRAWFWQDPEVPEQGKPVDKIDQVLQTLGEVKRLSHLPKVVTEEGVGVETDVEVKGQVDKLGYSKDDPHTRFPHMSPVEIMAQIRKLEKAGVDHTEIARQTLDWAYPAAGLSESLIVTMLENAFVTVPAKSVLYPTQKAAEIKPDVQF
jgi:hypothetical protein